MATANPYEFVLPSDVDNVESNLPPLTTTIATPSSTATSTSSKICILLHGFPDTPSTFIRLSEELNNHGYKVLTPFLPGYKQLNEKNVHMKPGTFSIVNLVKKFMAFLQEQDLILKNENGYYSEMPNSELHLIGHDWGSLIAQKTFESHPFLFQTITTMSVPFDILSTVIRLGVYKQLMCSWYMIFFQLPLLPEIFLHSLRGVDLLFDFWAPSWNDFSDFEQQNQNHIHNDGRESRRNNHLDDTSRSHTWFPFLERNHVSSTKKKSQQQQHLQHPYRKNSFHSFEPSMKFKLISDVCEVLGSQSVLWASLGYYRDNICGIGFNLKHEYLNFWMSLVVRFLLVFLYPVAFIILYMGPPAFVLNSLVSFLKNHSCNVSLNDIYDQAESKTVKKMNSDNGDGCKWNDNDDNYDNDITRVHFINNEVSDSDYDIKCYHNKRDIEPYLGADDNASQSHFKDIAFKDRSIQEQQKLSRQETISRILSITGELDGCVLTNLFDYQLSEIHFQKIENGQFNLFRIAKAGHWVHLEAPEIVHQKILHHLKCKN